MKHIAFAIVVGTAAAWAARVPSGTNLAYTDGGPVRYEIRQRADDAPGQVVAIAQLSSTHTQLSPGPRSGVAVCCWRRRQQSQSQRPTL